jgi:Domain of unknown function (DUF4158)
MPRRERLSEVQRSGLVGVPTDPESLARYYTLDARDLSLIRTKRGEHNRLGYAVQLAYLHFPGQALTVEASSPSSPSSWSCRRRPGNSMRSATRRAANTRSRRRPPWACARSRSPNIAGCERGSQNLRCARKRRRRSPSN